MRDLERIGGLAKNIAKRANVIANEPFPQDIVEETLSGYQASPRLKSDKDLMPAFRVMLSRR
ncbi:MAG: hypothetical protein AWT59_0345 [Candidatus Gallionella acididurans]|uniref:Uncharacterized protein n=1 Tax=Candidatus Gallionella acididurans TaxID=1796491 RepID=A0A139BWS8_9PROT|nr:MAG: hypothetical protein AWT59_0345 [Candidatus Gallionella acididurans]